MARNCRDTDKLPNTKKRNVLSSKLRPVKPTIFKKYKKLSFSQNTQKLCMVEKIPRI